MTITKHLQILRMNRNQDSVSPILLEILADIMRADLFNPFRLVGGTNLALRYNHRISTDIDLFTDYPYGSLPFNLFEDWMRHRYAYFEPTDTSSKVGMGKTYYVGKSKKDAIKIDLIYENEPFLFPEEENQSIRMATSLEIAVMKLDAIFYGGRKKDFWDLHYLVVDSEMNFADLIALHAKRFPYQHDRIKLLKSLQDFSKADDEPDPICNLGKSWDMIKLDMLDFCLELE